MQTGVHRISAFFDLLKVCLFHKFKLKCTTLMRNQILHIRIAKNERAQIHSKLPIGDNPYACSCKTAKNRRCMITLLSET